MKQNLVILLLLWSYCMPVSASVNRTQCLELKIIESEMCIDSSGQKKDSWFKRVKAKRIEKRSKREAEIEVKSVQKVEDSIQVNNIIVASLIAETKKIEPKIIVLESISDSMVAIKLRTDSIESLRNRLKLRVIKPTKLNNKSTAIDTLKTGSEHINVMLFDDNTWAYVNNREIIKDSLIFVKYWDTRDLTPYENSDILKMPNAIVIDLVDSLRGFHYPYKGSIHPRGEFGIRRGRAHQGIDLPLKTGDPIYATFCGRVRISTYNNGGYGNLVIIRHDNGLETYYGHLSKRFVKANQWVEAGDKIGLGGSTGRSSGPHLHFEMRYYGRSFDPQRLMDFENGTLCRQTFLLKQDYFSIYSKAPQNFEEEILNEEADKKEEAAFRARMYHKICSGDTLGHIAIKHGTTVARICSLNGIAKTKVLALGQSIRVF